jgi:FtsZ-interacting cell division protein ZipA
MPNQYGGPSRADRYNKKRKNTKAITYLSIIAGILVIVLLAIFLIGGNDSKDNDSENASDNVSNESNNNEEDSVIFNDSEQDDTNGQQEEAPNEENETDNENQSDEQTPLEVPDQEIETYEVPSENENVRAAYEGNWQPIGTTQEGPHTIQFEEESVDWKEMLQAVEYATGVAVDDQIVNWIGRAGEQAVNATITSKSNPNSIYRVQLQWIEEKGWQPTLVEELVEYIPEN